MLRNLFIVSKLMNFGSPRQDLDSKKNLKLPHSSISGKSLRTDKKDGSFYNESIILFINAKETSEHVSITQ